MFKVEEEYNDTKSDNKKGIINYLIMLYVILWITKGNYFKDNTKIQFFMKTELISIYPI